MRKLLLVLGVLVLMAGCGDDSPDAPDVVVPDPLPETPLLLVESFVTAQEDMSNEDLAHILHEDFQFTILHSTRDDWSGSEHPLTLDYFDRAATLDIYANLFGEVEGMDEMGNPIPYVESISVSVFFLEGTWEAIDEEDDFFESHPGALRARYSALLHFNNPNYHRWEVDQTLDLVAITVTVAGVEGWQLLAVRGYEGYGVVATENMSYDRILAMYRF